MILGSFHHSPDTLYIDSHLIQPAPGFKLLGIPLANDLRWDLHIDSIYVLKQTKKLSQAAKKSGPGN
jgi:hypothetical protein